jgi:hypothetical protein
MTPHPLATWVQLSVSPQRHAARRRRRLRAARLLRGAAARREADGVVEPTAPPRIPAQRSRPVGL